MKYLSFGFIFLILGSIIGAGFASGKEIEVFFSNAGIISFFVIFVSMIFLFFVLKNLITFSNNLKSFNISHINKLLFKKSSKFFDIFLIAGLFVFLVAMIAGLNSIGKVIFSNINFPVLTIISLFFVMFISILGIDAIKKVNLVLMPVVVLMIIVVSVFGIKSNPIQPENNFQISNIFSALKYLFLGLSYISYNIVFSCSLIFEKSKNFSKKQNIANSIALTLILVLLISFVNLAMLGFKINVDLPLLAIAFSKNSVTGYIFAVCLWFSILTSLISNLYIILNSFKTNKLLMSSIVLTLSFALSFFGFSTLINFIYPLQGVVCFVFIQKVFIFNKKSNVKNAKKVSKGLPKIVGFYCDK